MSPLPGGGWIWKEMTKEGLRYTPVLVLGALGSRKLLRNCASYAEAYRYAAGVKARYVSYVAACLAIPDVATDTEEREVPDVT